MSGSEHETIELRPRPYDHEQSVRLRLPPSSRRRLVLGLEVAFFTLLSASVLFIVFLLGLGAWVLTRSSA